MKGKVFLILYLLILSQVLSAGEWLLGETGSSVFLPEGWGINSRDEQRISFINPDENIIFQVTVYPGNQFSSDLPMMEEHLSEFAVLDQDTSRFYYRDRTCSMADVLFESGGTQVRGWFLFIEREDYDYYLTAITGPDDYQSSLPLILSCLDGFSPDQRGRREAGPVSHLISSSDKAEQISPLVMEEESFSYKWTRGREESSRLLIEREASILSVYNEPEIFDSAWKRYYQMIYRDSGDDLRELSSQFKESFKDLNDREMAETLLDWLQEFEYGSTERFSDLLSPTETLVTKTGDCDALSLVYIMLLNHMSIPAVLMVSREYSHALAAVAVDRTGAHFSYNDTEYVVAEMTKDVDLGQISSEMADLGKWVIIPFTDYVQGILPLENSNN